MITEQQAAETRVKRGARWLDENFPGWIDRIDHGTLDLTSGVDCICGQVFEDNPNGSVGYDYANDNLFSQANSWIDGLVGIKAGDPETLWDTGVPYRRIDALYDRRRRVAQALGFVEGSSHALHSDSDRKFVTYPALQRAWLNLIAARRQEVAA